jgi:hypothetical protein
LQQQVTQIKKIICVKVFEATVSFFDDSRAIESVWSVLTATTTTTILTLTTDATTIGALAEWQLNKCGE